MFQLSGDLWQIVLRTTIVFLIILLGLRILGKREMGQMTPFDLVLLLLLANAVQNAMTGPDTSVWGGLVGATTLIGITWGISLIRERFSKLRGTLEGQPTVLISRGTLLEKNLKREKIDREELEMAAREHGIEDLKNVELAVLEIDGSISIIPVSEHNVRVKRKLKALRHR
ncbi:MAG: DUF421 domain-containing protein [Caldiserica bacterium]|nr:DUF421 domain-containing protein [Caldisericota bacterium]MDH7562218.1 DUF421 domain-containing protein [Caldisericota bacterium]